MVIPFSKDTKKCGGRNSSAGSYTSTDAGAARIKPVDQWHDVIGNPTYADAILDCLVHNAYRINLVGHSLRRDWTAKPAKD